MEKILAGDNDIVLLLLMFITGLLTKRFVPWWVYEDILKKLKEYEEAAPELITRVNLLMELLNEEGGVTPPPVRVRPTTPTANPKVVTPSPPAVIKIRQRRSQGRGQNG